MLADLVYDSPAWAVVLAMLAAGLGFAAACQALARRFLAAKLLEDHAELVTFTVTNIAVLYAVLLAFLTVASWEGFTRASENAGVEASLVSNLYHDAQGLPPDIAADIGGHVRDYAAAVVRREWPEQSRGATPPEGVAALAKLHRHVARMAPAEGGDTVVMGDMLRVLNQLDGARAARLEGLGGQVPTLVWSFIVAMGLLLVAYAALLPAGNARLQAAMLFGLVLAIVLVLAMIVELDNPFRGALSVSADPYARVLAEILEPIPAGKD